MRLGPITVIAILFPLLFAPPARAQTVDTGATATEMAVAMGFPAAYIVSASLTTPSGGAADDKASAVVDGNLGTYMPKTGNTFAVLCTGRVSDIPGSNDATGTSYDLGVQDNLGVDEGGDDGVQLHVVVDPPDTALSVFFYHVFLSEEYPEFVGSPFNDFFTAEMVAQGGGSITFDSSGQFTEVIAPGNVVFDAEGKVMSVNNDYFIQDQSQTTGTEMDGQTVLLRTCAPLSGTDTMEFIFTVGDLGDAVLMSAVFLDGLTFEDAPIFEAVTVDPASSTVLGGSDVGLLPISYPNPFLPSQGLVTFSISQSACVECVKIRSVDIFDISGRKVITLPGIDDSILTWDGRNSRGSLVASGMYFYVVTAEDGRVGTGRFTLVK